MIVYKRLNDLNVMMRSVLPLTYFEIMFLVFFAIVTDIGDIFVGDYFRWNHVTVVESSAYVDG